MFLKYERPLTTLGLDWMSPVPVSEKIIDMLSDGMERGDEQLRIFCNQAMSTFSPAWLDVMNDESEVLDADVGWPPPTALDGDRSNWPDAREHVVWAVRDSLRIENKPLNVRAIKVAAAFPDEIVPTLARDVACTDIEPRHCERLLEAIDFNGGNLDECGARALLQLHDRRGFERAWPWARMLVWQRWELVGRPPEVVQQIELLSLMLNRLAPADLRALVQRIAAGQLIAAGAIS